MSLFSWLARQRCMTQHPHACSRQHVYVARGLVSQDLLVLLPIACYGLTGCSSTFLGHAGVDLVLHGCICIPSFVAWDIFADLTVHNFPETKPVWDLCFDHHAGPKAEVLMLLEANTQLICAFDNICSHPPNSTSAFSMLFRATTMEG